MLRVEYRVLTEDGRLVAFVARDLTAVLLEHIKPKGIGLLRTEAHVEQAIRDGIASAVEALARGR